MKHFYVGQKITLFWYGEKFVFERTDSGDWKLIHADSQIVPQDIIDGLPA